MSSKRQKKKNRKNALERPAPATQPVSPEEDSAQNEPSSPVSSPEKEQPDTGSRNRKKTADPERKSGKASKTGRSGKKSDKKKRSTRKKEPSGFGRAAALFLIFLASIIFWEVFLYRQIHGSFNGLTYWTLIFTPAEALFFTFFCGWFRKRWADRTLDIISMLAVWAFYLSQLVYFRIFGSMFSVSMVGMAGDAVGNFGWALISTIKTSVGVIVFTTIPVVLFLLTVFIRKKTFRYSPWIHLAVLILIPALWFGAVTALPLGGTEEHSVYSAYHSHLIDTDTSSSKIGILANSIVELSSILMRTAVIPEEDSSDLTEVEEPFVPADHSPNILEDIDFEHLSEIAPDSTTQELCEYLKGVSGSPRNEYTGMLKDYNLIYICAESFSNLALDSNVTPTLCKLASEGFVLTNYYNSYKNTTTNGEFSFLTSLWPDVSRDAMFGTSVGSFANSADNFMPFGLGTVFREQLGASARAYHNYYGSYYCRDESLPNLGFDCKFMDEGMYFSTIWPSSDLEMMEQSINDYIFDDRFCAYYMTFSGHGPYSDANVMYNWNIDEVRSLLGDRELTYGGEGYLACNYELEKAIAYLMQRLEEEGRLDKTMIVLTGDHYPYYVYEEDRNSLAGHEVETEFELYKSTCIMWVGGMDEPVIVDTPCCNIDILPTVYNLFGIDYDSRLLAGRDILASSSHYAALYNKNFITSDMMYNSATGETIFLNDNGQGEHYWDTYFNYYFNQVRNRYSMSLKIEDCDFYRFVWENTEFTEPEPEEAEEPPPIVYEDAEY